MCDDCRTPGSSTPAPQTVALLAALQAGDWAVADAADAPAAHQAGGIVAAYLQFHVERRLVSLTVLDSLTHLATAGALPVRRTPSPDKDPR